MTKLTVRSKEGGGIELLTEDGIDIAKNALSLNINMDGGGRGRATVNVTLAIDKIDLSPELHRVTLELLRGTRLLDVVHCPQD